MVILVQLCLVLLGTWMLRRGWSGRRTDDHPVCARCKFDLSGRPDGSDRCPECGASLDEPRAIQAGNRHRRNRILFVGLSLCVINGMMLLASAGSSLMKIDAVRFEPLWLLLREGTDDTEFGENRYCREILHRATNRRFDADDAERIATIVLALQADLTRPWNATWGDIIEQLNVQGVLSNSDWHRYLAQDEPATLQVRANVARGDPIAYSVRGEMRGATPWSTSASVGRVFVKAAVAGCTTVEQPWAGGLGRAFEVHGCVSLTDASWNRLSAGRNPLSITIGNVGAYVATRPQLFAPINLTGHWTMLGDGKRSVELYRDEALAERIQRSLTCELTATRTGDISVSMQGENLPVNLACDVFLRSGDVEVSAPKEWIMLDPFPPHSMGSAMCFDAQSKFQGGSVDVILRPSVAAAVRTVWMTRLLDHEFLFKNVVWR